jgi:hypothetical protein
MKPYNFHNNLSSLLEISFKTLPEVAQKITQLFKKQDIEFCVIGGIAVSSYGYERTTTDIDLLVDAKDKDKFDSLIGVYFSPRFNGAKKKLFWNDPKVKVDVIFSGEHAGSEKGDVYPQPYKIDDVIDGIPVIDLKSLIRFKLTSGLYGEDRISDFGDVQRLVKINKLPKNLADTFPDAEKAKYLELWTDREMED